MKTLWLTTLALVFSCLPAGSAHARSALYAVTKQDGMADGVIFHLDSTALADGTVKFRVIITEDQGLFNEHPFTEIGLLENTKSSRSIDSTRKVSAVHKGNTLACDFIVDRKSLADPRFCFLYSNLKSAIDDKLLFLIPANFVFIRLKDFAPKQP